jgi:glutathione S-transferase
MKLFLNTTSPYARLIHVLLLETGLEAQTELVLVDPWKADDHLLAANPASKIPALSLDDGTHLIESACIADYLIQQSGKQILSPLAHADAPQRLEVLGLGRAAMDCAFGAVIQHRFVPGSPLSARWLGTLPRIAERLNALYARRTAWDEPDLGSFTVAVAFEYIAFRLPAIGWRSLAPNLTAQVDRLGGRAALVATRHS